VTFLTNNHIVSETRLKEFPAPKDVEAFVGWFAHSDRSTVLVAKQAVKVIAEGAMYSLVNALTQGGPGLPSGGNL
jgi:hypothetical protein